VGLSVLAGRNSTGRDEQDAAQGTRRSGFSAKLPRCMKNLGRENQISKPVPDNEQFYLDAYLIPKWGGLRLNVV
jgi:hypothetical protein